MSKKRNRKFSLGLDSSPVRKRSPEKVKMDTLHRPKVWRSRKRQLETKDADRQIQDYMRGLD